MVEIGAGGGVLTEELLEAGSGTLTAWEIDLSWVGTLAARFRAARWPAGRLRLVGGDALAIDWRRQAMRPTVVAGNLPYNVATAIIERLVRNPGQIQRAAFLIQKEVAERMTSAPGSRDYGGLSLLVQAHARVRRLGRVPPGAFRPPPKVDSAFVGLEPVAPPLSAVEMKSFLTLVRLAFGQRRKTLVNALAAGPGKAAARQALEAIGLPPRCRAEELALEDFLALHRALAGG